MTTTWDRPEGFEYETRRVEVASPGDPRLGPLAQLPGTWKGEGTGWNMIALPFAPTGPGTLNYRLLLNQYDEDLVFTFVDSAVPNRGLDATRTTQTDQFVVTLDYEQVVKQVAVTDRPESTVRGGVPAAIHHEPGLFLSMTNEIPDGFDIARLATIPHGDAALALGTSSVIDGPPSIPRVNGFPIGTGTNTSIGYLEPYNHFAATPFVGTVTFPGFPGFDPTQPQKLLELALAGITRTTVLELDTTHDTGGIRNIPFVVRHANAASMKSTFWIEELDDGGLQLQYLQIVMLDFFPRFDGQPGLIGWPHVSINTLRKVADTPAPAPELAT